MIRFVKVPVLGMTNPIYINVANIISYQQYPSYLAIKTTDGQFISSTLSDAQFANLIAS